MTLSSESWPKRWIYVLIHRPPYVVSVAIVHAGYAGNAFVSCVEVPHGGKPARTLFDQSWLTLPKLGVSLNTQSVDAPFYAGFTAPGVLIEAQGKRADEPVRVVVQAKGLELEATLGWRAQAEPLKVASHLYGKPELGPIATAKYVLMPIEGSLRVADESPISLGGAWGGVDLTEGHVPRHTRWYWSFAMGTPSAGDGSSSAGARAPKLAWNFANGNNLGGALENALWWNQKKHTLGRIEFQAPRESSQAWKIGNMSSEDGVGVDLEFTPHATHTEGTRFLSLLRSQFKQMTGSYRGRIRIGSESIAVMDLAGVLEDQDTIW